MNVQMVSAISVLTTALTPLAHTHVAVTQAINSMKMDFAVMVCTITHIDKAIITVFLVYFPWKSIL